jgi:hypothetical protein
MTRFSQWWKRMVRAGYGSADVAKRFNVARFAVNNRRVLAWTIWLAAVFALALISATTASRPAGIAVAFLLGILPARIVRIAVRTRLKGHPWKTATAYACFMTISFLPQVMGQTQYLIDRLRRKSNRLIEYKTPPGLKEPHRNERKQAVRAGTT